MPQVKIAISPKGDVKIEGVGFVGPACEAALKPLRDVLAGSTEVLKSEYHQTAGIQQGG